MRITIARGAVEPGRQLIDGARSMRLEGDAESEHRGIAQPEGQSGHEADLRDVDGAQAPGRIDPVSDRAAGKHACSDIVTHRIAGEAGKRSHPVGHVGASDRAQRKQVVERQREIARGNEQRSQRDVARVAYHQRFDHFVDVDVAQDAIERHHRDRDDGDAQDEADPVPADLLVAKMRRCVERCEHLALTLG